MHSKLTQIIKKMNQISFDVILIFYEKHEIEKVIINTIIRQNSTSIMFECYIITEP